MKRTAKTDARLCQKITIKHLQTHEAPHDKIEYWSNDANVTTLRLFPMGEEKNCNYGGQQTASTTLGDSSLVTELGADRKNGPY